MKTIYERCFDCFTFRVNVVFAFTGSVLIYLGYFVNNQVKEYSTFLKDPFGSVPTVIIITGVLLFAISFFPCCGSPPEGSSTTRSFLQPYMRPYLALLAFIFLAELGAGSYLFVLRNTLKQNWGVVVTDMQKGLNNYNTGEMKEAWDSMQRDVKCCGVKGPRDWINSSRGNIPESCCVILSDVDLKCVRDGAKENKNVYSKGCDEALKEKFLHNFSNVGFVPLLILCFPLVQLLGVFLGPLPGPFPQLNNSRVYHNM